MFFFHAENFFVILRGLVEILDIDRNILGFSMFSPPLALVFVFSVFISFH